MFQRIFIAGLIVLSVFACRKKQNDQEVYEPYKKDTQQVVETKSDTIIKKEPVKKIKEIDRGVDLDDNFFIVVASYTVEDFARERLIFFKKEGFKPAIFMKNDDGWYKLAVESYNNFDEAKKARKKLLEKGDAYKAARIVRYNN